jgi:hypothetical protein
MNLGRARQSARLTFVLFVALALAGTAIEGFAQSSAAPGGISSAAPGGNTSGLSIEGAIAALIGSTVTLTHCIRPQR